MPNLSQILLIKLHMFKVSFSGSNSSLSALERPTEKLNHSPICPPGTEIFSKRRKIYSVCVESLSLTIDNCSTSLFCFEMNLDVASYNRVHLLTSATLDLKTTTKSII